MSRGLLQKELLRTTDTGNNLGLKERKIQAVWDRDAWYPYIDSKMLNKFDYIWTATSSQFGANLAVGSLRATGLHANGFYPLDFSQFPMKFSIKRMRLLQGGPDYKGNT